MGCLFSGKNRYDTNKVNPSSRKIRFLQAWQPNLLPEVYASAVNPRLPGYPLLTARKHLKINLMQTLAIGMWGFFFGASLLVLAGAVFAFSRSMYRIGVNAALATICPVFVISAFFGILPIPDRNDLLRFLAHITVVVGCLLVYQLLNTLGTLTTTATRKRAKLLFTAVCVVALSASWFLRADDALRLCGGVVFLMAVYAWGVSIRNALSGDKLAWVAVIAVASVVSSYFGLSFGVLNPDQWTWPIHALSAGAATGYTLTLGFIVWQRYAFMLELKKVMVYGPAYDPVTRMRSHEKTAQLARQIFDQHLRAGEPLGVIVLTIANLYALEKLHGAAAVNSALFLTATRLKRALPSRVEVGLSGSDGFLIIMRNCSDTGRLIMLAHELNQHLHQSVKLTTNPEIEQLETASTVWQAQIGIGALHVKTPGTSYLFAITMGRKLARTAISYASRVAWFDHSSGEIVELPAMQQ